MSYACPSCKSSNGLWRDVEVPGWQSVDTNLKPLVGGGYQQREVEWHGACASGTYGCGKCDWRGRRDLLVTLGIDGEPLPVIAPGQRSLDDAA